MSRALQKRLGIDSPRWRAFQLAFILLNLPGLIDSSDPNREIVDLLFFPTGGGKTEAYFGLSAFAMVLRRLRHPEEKGMAGGGVSVMMRYTLRLLTLDQLARAAGLVCALELERQNEVERYGDWPFEIGLWVGKAGSLRKIWSSTARIGSGRSLVKSHSKLAHTIRSSRGSSLFGTRVNESGANRSPHQGQFSSGMGEGFPLGAALN